MVCTLYCDRCRREVQTYGRKPGERCGLNRGRGETCNGRLRYDDARALVALHAVILGVREGRSRTDICTDLAGGRGEVTGEVRAFVGGVCDLLDYKG